MKVLNLTSLIIVLTVCAAAPAAIYTGDVEYTAGTGSNEATIAIDFDFDNSFLMANIINS